MTLAALALEMNIELWYTQDLVGQSVPVYLARGERLS